MICVGIENQTALDKQDQMNVMLYYYTIIMTCKSLILYNGHM